MQENEQALLIVVACVIVGLGLAANILTPEGEPVIAAMPNVFYAVLAGAVTGMLGYTQKSTLPDWETAKFFITLIISAISGFIVYQYGFTFNEAETWLAVIGVDVLVERLLKMIIRRSTAT